MIEGLSLRTEKHGQDKLPACDVKLSCGLDADVLALFSPTLKSHLFDTESSTDLAGGMPVRYPHWSYPIQIDDELSGMEVGIDFGGSSEIQLSDCRVHGFRITPVPGGSVVLGLTARCRPSGKVLGRLFELLDQPVKLRVEPDELTRRGIMG